MRFVGRHPSGIAKVEVVTMVLLLVKLEPRKCRKKDTWWNKSVLFSRGMWCEGWSCFWSCRILILLNSTIWGSQRKDGTGGVLWMSFPPKEEPQQQKKREKTTCGWSASGCFFFPTEHVWFFVQGPLNYLFWGDETLQIYGKFRGFPV